MNKEKEKKQRIRTKEEKQNYIKRLNRAEGQIKGIKKMIEEDRECDDIMIQISAVNNALKSLGQEVLLNHMKTCMVEDINNKHYETVEEIMKLLIRMTKWNIDII